MIKLVNTERCIVFSVCVIVLPPHFLSPSLRCISNPLHSDVGISWLAPIFPGMFPWAVWQSRASFHLESTTIVSRLVLLYFLRFFFIPIINCCELMISS